VNLLELVDERDGGGVYGDGVHDDLVVEQDFEDVAVAVAAVELLSVADDQDEAATSAVLLGERLRGGEADEGGLRAVVPVSGRGDVARGGWGNKGAAMWPPLPVGIREPVARLAEITTAAAQQIGLKAGSIVTASWKAAATRVLSR